jgi:hypothetical protein
MLFKYTKYYFLTFKYTKVYNISYITLFNFQVY